MNVKSLLIGAGISASLFTGGIVGALVMSPLGASAATTTPAATTAPAAPAAGAPFVSNENATHEAGESAAREAQENAGQMPTVP
jgi:hypothetical protein